jgi:ferric-dicitrate binding protein FerR (iron transport regulator)
MSFQALREAWLDGSLDEAGCAELGRLAAADPALVRQLAEAQRSDLLLRQAFGRTRDLAPGVMAGLRGQASRGNLRRAVMRSVRRRPQRRPVWPWLLAAAAGLAVAVLLLQRSPAPIGQITEVAGGVELLRGGTQLAMQVGMPVLAGDLLRTRDGRLRFTACAADLILGPTTAVEVRSELVHLAQGSLEAEIQPHPAEAPLVFTAPGARATVLGTVLGLRTDGATTRLDVQRGRVRLQGDVGGAIEVPAGSWGEVQAGAGPVAWRPLFPSGLAGWQQERGTWTMADGVVRGGPAAGRSRLASDVAYADLELTCAIRVAGADFAEVQLNDYSWFVEIPAGGWRQVRIRQQGLERSCLVDGKAASFQPGRPGGALAAGQLAFYIRAGGTVEIQEASLRVLP